jgi:hypothetical protein
MFFVHGRAYVTLAAVHALDSSGGLFSQTPLGYQACEPSPLHLNGKSCRLFARRVLPSFHSWESHVMERQSPLLTRAWAYQERLVSPRFLHFTRHELLWECYRDAGCECTREAPPWDDWVTLRYRGNCPKLLHNDWSTLYER